ncbi:MAG TPA: Rieske (2Fe-2S) protein [Polyangiales bacterium]|nr:Rieske (2Fe-2S) protein [Polyangiales bacterium]
MTFQRVAELDELWSGEKRGVLVEGEPVLLVRLEDTVHAYSDRCLHKRALLSTGMLRGHTLRCSAHEWEYNLETGECVNPRGLRLRRFAVELREGGIWVDVAGANCDD